MNKSIILYRGSSEQRLDPEICSLVRHIGVWRNRNRKRKKKKIGHVVVYIFLAPRTNDTKQCESYNWQRRFLVPACNAFKRKVTIAGWGSAKQRRKCKGIHQQVPDAWSATLRTAVVSMRQHRLGMTESATAQKGEEQRNTSSLQNGTQGRWRRKYPESKVPVYRDFN